MGLFGKLQELFTEDVEEEVPIKKEVMKVEIPDPKEEEEKMEKVEILEPEVKKEEKRTPVFFDDKDFINLEQPKVEKKVEAPKKVEIYGGVKKEEPKKHFSPSPIISPVYGVLDKNYHKEDIASKGERKTSRYQRLNTPKNLTVDDVMKKAYGTLEDELEDTLTGKNSILFKEEPEEPVVEQKSEKEILEDFGLTEEKVEDELPSIQRENLIDPLSGLELDVQEDDLLNDNFGDEEETPSKENTEEKEEHNKEEDLDLKESDLFNLIDSMYEKRDEE